MHSAQRSSRLRGRFCVYAARKIELKRRLPAGGKQGFAMTTEKAPHRFQKGQSGNPSGRAKKTPEQITLEEKCKELTPEALATITQIMTDGENERNRLAAAQYVIDRGWGKARQEVVGTMDHNLAVTMITRRIIGGDGPKSGN